MTGALDLPDAAAGSASPSPDGAAAVAAALVDLLDLRSLPVDRALDGPGTIAVWEGDSSPQPGGHVFGGQVMGQAVTAAGRTVPEGRAIHSTFSYFLAPGDPDQPIRFRVENLRDGGSFSVRRVLATQRADAGPSADGPAVGESGAGESGTGESGAGESGTGESGAPTERTILAMTASYQERQEGFEHQQRAPEVPGPEDLPTTADVLAGIDHPVARYWATQRPIDIRHVTQPIYLAPDPRGAGTDSTTSDTQMVWMRTVAPLDADALVHDAILAFASDYTPFEPILRRQGLSWITPGLRMATIDHAIWWHRHVRADEWLLYVQHSPSASGGRGLTNGHVYDRAGDLVATVTQEGMIRARSGAAQAARG